MAQHTGIVPVPVAFTGNGTVQIPAAAADVPRAPTRTKGSLQVILSGGSNFTGGTVSVYPSNDGVNRDATALATFTIGTDSSGGMKFWLDKPCGALAVVAAGLTGGSGTPTATAWVAWSD